MASDPIGVGRSGAGPVDGAWRMERHAELESTNETALARARDGDRGPLWVIAERQTAGRGRRGRVWVSDDGNLYASALLVDPCDPRHLPELPFVAVTAARRAVAAHVARSEGRVTIKWPNDLLVDGAKAAGILLESTRAPDGAIAVAIGIGINCRIAPSGTETPATSLEAAGAPVSAEDLFGSLAEALRRRVGIWNRGEGFAEIRSEWLAHARGIGEPIRVRLVAGEERGIFEAIDSAGHLILRTGDGRRRVISAGDVFFPAGAE